MPRLYDHIDLRVRNLAEARPFYEVMLPALGFARATAIPNWFQYEARHQMTDRLHFSASPNRPVTCRTRAESRSGRKAPRKSIAWLGSPPALVRETSKVLGGKMKLTTPSFSKTPAATVWKSATVLHR
jgi:hypothetical protein